MEAEVLGNLTEVLVWRGIWVHLGIIFYGGLNFIWVGSEFWRIIDFGDGQDFFGEIPDFF